MGEQDFSLQLTELARFVEHTDSLEQGLDTLARLIAHAMGCSHCSIMLVKQLEGDGRPMLRVEAHHGYLPEETLSRPISLDSGIAGHVATTGQALFIENLHQSRFGSLAQRAPKEFDDIISVPILLEDSVVGVINIDSPETRPRLDTDDLKMATVLALTVAQSIRIHRLQGLLKTCFMQSILARAGSDGKKPTTDHIDGDPDRLIRVIAQTLFREMKQVGFARDHILGLATELIARVSDNLTRDRKDAKP